MSKSKVVKTIIMCYWHKIMTERKNKQPQLISSLLSDFFQIRLSDPNQKIRFYLERRWTEICKTFPSTILTKPVDYQSGHLLLWVKSSVEIQELSFYKEELKKQINIYLKKHEIKEISFTINQKLLQKKERSLNLLNQFK